MSTQSQPTYDGCLPNFLLPRSEAHKRVQEMAEFFASPSVLEDDIACLEAEIAEHQKGIAEAEEDLQRKNFALAVAYAKPEYDRRRPHDERNETVYETLCRGIESSVTLQIDRTSCFVWWYGEDAKHSYTPLCGTVPDAWRACFAILDRRSAAKS